MVEAEETKDGADGNAANGDSLTTGLLAFARQGQASTSQPSKNSSSKLRKFTPRIVTRTGRSQAAELPAVKSEDDTFKNLTQMAQDPASWARKARGRGRGRRPDGKVTFGGGRSSGGAAGFATARSHSRSQSALRSPEALSRADGVALPSSSKPKLMRADGQELGIKAKFKVASDDEREADEDVLDYNVYYPTLLPNRVPGSQLEPELELLEAVMPSEFAEESEEESLVEALGVMELEPGERSQAMLFQLPATLPIPAHTAAHQSAAKARLSARPEDASQEPAAASLADLKPGKLGKLLVFESGKVKLQLGDVLLDVSLGEESQCAQEFFAMSVAGTSAVSMGEVARRVVCTPDIEHLLSDEAIPNWQRIEREEVLRVKEEPPDGQAAEAKENGDMDADELVL